MQWGILALLVLLPLLQGDSAITQVSPAQNDILRQEENSKEFSSNLDLDSNFEFVEESSEETIEGDFTGKGSGENTEKPVKKFVGELQWKFGEDAILEHSNDYTWDYNDDFSWESSGLTSEEYKKEATDDSTPGMTVVSTTVKPSIKMVSAVIKEPTPIP